MKRKKAFAVFMAVLLIGLFIFFAAFIGFPDHSVHVPHELSGNHETYSNFGFNFGYPVEWHHIFARLDSSSSQGFLHISDASTTVKRGIWVNYLTDVTISWNQWSSIKDHYENLQGYVNHHFEYERGFPFLGMQDTYVILRQSESQICGHNATVVIANYTMWIAPNQKLVSFSFFWICTNTDRLFTLTVTLMRIQITSSDVPPVVQNISETFNCH